eukprot:jgi/Tetstr1/436873/TSEL_025649.t1
MADVRPKAVVDSDEPSCSVRLIVNLAAAAPQGAVECDEPFCLRLGLSRASVASHAVEDRLNYVQRFECKKALTGEERVAERLVYSRFFDIITATERSSNGVDGLVSALED